MDCREYVAEIVECARAGNHPSRRLQAHLRECISCERRWETERSLAGPLRRLRAAASAESSSVIRRAELMNEFGKIYRSGPKWRLRWAFAAAAAVLFVLALGITRRAGMVSGPDHLDQVAVQWRAASAGGGPAEDAVPDDGGFVQVPFAPPLATGEMVKVVRTELYAAALNRMGFSVGEGSGEFPAEVVVGEDGMPRAVRVLTDVQF